MQESSEKTSSNQRGYFLKIWHQHNLPKVSIKHFNPFCGIRASSCGTLVVFQKTLIIGVKKVQIAFILQWGI